MYRIPYGIANNSISCKKYVKNAEGERVECNVFECVHILTLLCICMFLQALYKTDNFRQLPRQSVGVGDGEPGRPQLFALT